MRSTPVIAVILSLGMAFALLGGSGIAFAVFGEDASDSKTAKTVEEVGKDADVGCDDPEGDCEAGEGGIGADVGGDDEPTLRGFGLGAAALVIKVVGAVAFLPNTLMGLGLPDFFARPVRRLAQFVATVGVFQFIRTGEYL